jgi:hypothetical protein
VSESKQASKKTPSPDQAAVNPSFDFFNVDLERVGAFARDALYVGVGLAVLGIQQLQVRRRELEKLLDERMGSGKNQVGELREAVDKQLRIIDERVEALEVRIDSVLDDVQGRLPDQAAELLGQARGVAKATRKQVIDLVRVDRAA